MPSYDITLFGLPEAQAMMRTLPIRIQNDALRPTLREGAKVIAAAVKARAPVASGRLRASIKVRAGLRKRSQVRMVVLIGDRVALGIPALRKDGKPRGYYPMAIEYGIGQPSTSPKKNRKREAVRALELGGRKVAARPFIRPAFESSREAALSKMREVFPAFLEKAIGKGIDRVAARFDAPVEAVA